MRSFILGQPAGLTLPSLVTYTRQVKYLVIKVEKTESKT